jgi:hypothetical protein
MSKSTSTTESANRTAAKLQEVRDMASDLKGRVSRLIERVGDRLDPERRDLLAEIAEQYAYIVDRRPPCRAWSS